MWTIADKSGHSVEQVTLALCDLLMSGGAVIDEHGMVTLLPEPPSAGGGGSDTDALAEAVRATIRIGPSSRARSAGMGNWGPPLRAIRRSRASAPLAEAARSGFVERTARAHGPLTLRLRSELPRVCPAFATPAVPLPASSSGVAATPSAAAAPRRAARRTGRRTGSPPSSPPATGSAHSAAPGAVASKSPNTAAPNSVCGHSSRAASPQPTPRSARFCGAQPRPRAEGQGQQEHRLVEDAHRVEQRGEAISAAAPRRNAARPP